MESCAATVLEQRLDQPEQARDVRPSAPVADNAHRAARSDIERIQHDTLKAGYCDSGITELLRSPSMKALAAQLIARAP